MAIELAGIENENEFYSNHNLTTVLETDIRETVASWSDDGDKSPPKLLEELAGKWISSAGEYARTKDTGARVAVARDFADRLLGALGYQRAVETRETVDGKLVPVQSVVVDADGKDRVWIVEGLAPYGDDFDTTDILATPFDCKQYDDARPKEDRAKGEIDSI